MKNIGDMGTTEFKKWLRENIKKDGGYPNLKAEDAFHIIRRHLLGKHWVIGDPPVGELQANAIIVSQILEKYPTPKFEELMGKTKPTIRIWKIKDEL